MSTVHREPIDALACFRIPVINRYKQYTQERGKMQKIRAAGITATRSSETYQLAVGYGISPRVGATGIVAGRQISYGTQSELRTELVRKTIHLMVALIPSLASFAGVGLTIAFLGMATVVYAYAEVLRLSGRPVAIISFVTTVAARDRDQGRFVLGPVTLAIGAMLALLLYPEPAASIAIYALAFGDGLSSLVGKSVGRVRIPFTRGKTWVGSATCFAAVYFVTLAITGSPVNSTIIAVAASLLEMIPAKDLDNLLLPIGVGLLANWLMLV